MLQGALQLVSVLIMGIIIGTIAKNVQEIHEAIVHPCPPQTRVAAPR